MNLWKRTLASIALAAIAAQVHAETAEDAKALLAEIQAEVKAKGFEAAAKEFNAGGKWRRGRMYVVMVDFKGHMHAHSINDKIVGKNMYEALDASGKPFIQEIIKSVAATGSAHVPMRWGNPVTQKIDDGAVLASRVAGQDIYVGAVYFK
jgi:signal transduction histidine kinase